jgi:hypothetical protein
LEKALTLGSSIETTSAITTHDEVHRLKLEMIEQETKWKQAYEKVVKENELLKNHAGEAIIAAQWRGRYESCLKEKEDCLEKLKLFTFMTTEVNENGKSIEQLYVELQEEFKVFFISFFRLQN